ncbi:hypothetical protein OpiT1DRAFT_04664 [Opitutaceae bacterium TAV1]|nr:hypothetical protein OpiT1DRAFT_04664 [Opitutaceae bacterium TAV1]
MNYSLCIRQSVPQYPAIGYVALLRWLMLLKIPSAGQLGYTLHF